MMGIDNIKFAKPGKAKWRVVSRSDDVHVVYRPDGQVYGTYPTLNRAAATAGVRQKEDDLAARRTVRSCMCCGEEFQSAGIHNRMCTPCRSRSVDSWDPYGLAPRSGRAK